MEAVETNRAPVTLPRMLKVLLAIFLVALVAGCGSKDESAADAKSDKVLHVYNWADYIGDSTIREFEARTGIRVVYDVYDASEVLETKLLTGSTGNEHAVPYLRGTTGIGYNPGMVEMVLGTRTIDSLAAIFDPASASIPLGRWRARKRRATPR